MKALLASPLSVVALAALALPAAPPAHAQTDGLESRAFLFNEVGEFEEEPNFPLGFVPNHHVQSAALANESGQVLLLFLAHFQLWGQRSTDGGETYGTPFSIETARPVLGFQAYRSEDERVYLAYRFAGLTKDVGLRFRRSDDMGLNWTSPVDLVGEGAPQHGVANIWNIHANELGRVAVAFSETWEAADTYVTVSSSFGATWTTPVKPDLDTVAGRVPVECKVLVDQAGNVHVPYVQNRGSGQRVFYSRSTDGGVSFGGELAVGSVSGAGAQFGMDAGITRQGRIVISTGDGGQSVRIFQSANAGLTFSQVSFWGNMGTPASNATRVAASYFSDTVLVGYLNDTGAIYTLRSPDEGATFSQPTNRSIGGTRAYSVGQTNDGVWVLVHERQATGSDPYPNLIQAARSTDDGVTFGTPDQVDHSGGVDSGESRLTGVQTTNGPSGIVVLYRDFRSGDRQQTYVNRTTSATFDFTAERLVGPYGNVDNRLQPASAFSGAPIVLAATPDTVHLLYRMIEQGTRTDLYHARSTDGGDTYGIPVRLGQHPLGTEETTQYALAVNPDDPQRLYAVHSRFNYATSRSVLMLRRSQNGGGSWLPEQTIVDLGSTTVATLRVAVTADDRVLVFYSSGSDLAVVRSYDDGANWFLPIDFDQQVSGFTVINDLPVVCTSGTLVAVVWRTNLSGGNYQTIHARVSTDSGVSYSTAVSLRPGQTTSANVPDVECAGNEAFAVWADFRDPSLTRAWGNRYLSGAWQGERQVAPAQTRSQFVPRVIYTRNGSTPTPLLVYTDNFQVFTNRSLDGGTTWQAAQRLDDIAPQPLAASLRPYLVADGRGNTWAVWGDASPGQVAIAARRSLDGGSSWEGLVVRLNSEPNQGAKFNLWLNGLELPLSASGGTMHATWVGHRDSPNWDTRVARWGAPDGDGDGVAASVDCDNTDPTIGTAPVEVTGVLVERVTGASRVRWNSQDATAGSATSYDLVTGDLAALRASGGFTAATCLVNDVPDTPYDDSRSGPATGAGWYYLVRAQHACTGTYGSSRPFLTGVCP
ncbi:MAG: glycoside hydrolase [Acidobacteria bacterium]|jgi:hypothetical protein|nr:glycoside hydrolase [Acidobacteriota bacterium]